MYMKNFGRVLFAGLLVLTACGDDAIETLGLVPQLNSPATPQTVAESSFTTSSTGLKIHDFVVGTGDVAAASTTVSVHYTGWLTNGSKFDSSLDRGELFVFTLGIGQVIGGWDEGVEGMRVGGKRQLVIPPSLGYGASGAGTSIPPNATLVFEIELLAVN
jgi:FKBP-type peptidyl-prolyl cis-trans isomerase